MTADTLLLWRHGRTEWNATDRIQGQADVGLDEVGTQQARQAASLLAVETPDTIISSDLKRTARTAETLSELTNVPVQFDVRLRERAFGPWEGRTAGELLDSWPEEYAVWRAGGDPPIPGIETDKELTDRVLAGVQAAISSTHGTVCVVTHGGAARRALFGLLQWPSDLSWRMTPLGNCRWAELRHGRKGWRLAAYNLGPSSGAAGPNVPLAIADMGPK